MSLLDSVRVKTAHVIKRFIQPSTRPDLTQRHLMCGTHAQIETYLVVTKKGLILPSSHVIDIRSPTK